MDDCPNRDSVGGPLSSCPSGPNGYRPRFRTPLPAPRPRPVVQGQLPAPQLRRACGSRDSCCVSRDSGSPKLLRRHSDLCRLPRQGRGAVLSTYAGQVRSCPQEAPANAPSLSIAEEDGDPELLFQCPALVHPETIHEHEEDTSTSSEVICRALVHGKVAHQAMPGSALIATGTIRGTVKVNVKVNVDRSGNVEDAELESPGRAKYFARAALKLRSFGNSSRPKVGGRGVP